MKSFTIYEEYFGLITILPEKEAKDLWYKIAEYMFYDIEPKLNNNQNKVFNSIKRPLDTLKTKSKNGSITNQNKIKAKSKQNQNKIKAKSKQNQNKIKNKSKQNPIYDVNVNVNDNVNVNNIVDYLEKNNIILSSTQFEELNGWLEDFTEDEIIEAFNVMIEQQKGFNYVRGIVRNWRNGDTKKAKVPNWFNEDVKSEPLSAVEQNELKEIIESYKED